jgi:hypothetical protein
MDVELMCFLQMAGVRGLAGLLFTGDPWKKAELAMPMLFPSSWLDQPSEEDPSKTNFRVQAEVRCVIFACILYRFSFD